METFSSNYFEKLCGDLELRNAKLWEWGLLPKEGDIICVCGAEMKLRKNSSTADGNLWRCYRKVSLNKQRAKECDSRKSFRYGTIFENSRLPIWKILSFIHLWLTHMNLRDISNNLDLSTTATSHWGSWCYKVVLNGIMDNKVKLGGPGRTVEIDESTFGKRGHKAEGQWIFGGIERETGRVFMVPVEDRSRKTLLKIIKGWIEPGTTIISDCWKACNVLEDEGYIHLTVNHKLNFVDPESGTHTNSIESSSRHAKSMLPECSRKNPLYASYLAYYMFKKQCNVTKKCATMEFFKYATHFIKKSTSYDEDIDLLAYEDENVNMNKKVKHEGPSTSDEYANVEHLNEEYLDEDLEYLDVEYLDEDVENLDLENN